MQINLQNVEQLIFMDRNAQSLLPKFNHLFDQYRLSHFAPGLKSLGQRSVLELLNSLDGSHVAALSEYFGEEVEIQKLSHKIVEHYDFNTEYSGELCRFSGYKEFCLTRHKDEIKASFWR